MAFNPNPPTSGLHFLSSDDFSVVEGPNGAPLMVQPIRGLSMVMFYSNSCTHCQTLMPLFKKLPEVVKGANFALANVSTHKAIVGKSRGTNTQIDYVPLVIFYVEGSPFAQYTGNHTMEELLSFIKEMASRAQQKQQFASAPQRTPVAQAQPPQAPPRAPQNAPLPQGVPSAMTRPGNGGGMGGPPPPQGGQGGMGAGQGASQGGQAPIDSEPKPHKPSMVCYVSWEDAYGQ